MIKMSLIKNQIDCKEKQKSRGKKTYFCNKKNLNQAIKTENYKNNQK